MKNFNATTDHLLPGTFAARKPELDDATWPFGNNAMPIQAELVSTRILPPPPKPETARYDTPERDEIPVGVFRGALLRWLASDGVLWPFADHIIPVRAELASTSTAPPCKPERDAAPKRD